MPCQSQSVKSVSVVRSTGRSISHDSPVSLSISLSVSVGACTKNNTRPRALTSAVRSFALSTSSLSLHLIPSISRAPIPPIHEVATSFVLCDRTERIASPILKRLLVLPIAAAHIKHRTDPRTCKRIHDAGRTKSRGRESAHEIAEEHDEESRESGTERRTMHRRPTWVPRTKLTRYVNCLSNLPLVYIQIYKYIMHICTYTYMCTCV